MGILAAIGAAAWPILRALVPWAGPKTIMVLIAAVALLASHGGVAGYVWVKGYQARVEAVANVRAEFREALAREKEAHDAKVQAAIEAAEHEQPVSADRAERLRQCAASPSCRDRRRQ
jgi:hypothetical protein